MKPRKGSKADVKSFIVFRLRFHTRIIFYCLDGFSFDSKLLRLFSVISAVSNSFTQFYGCVYGFDCLYQLRWLILRVRISRKLFRFSVETGVCVKKEQCGSVCMSVCEGILTVPGNSGDAS